MIITYRESASIYFVARCCDHRKVLVLRYLQLLMLFDINSIIGQMHGSTINTEIIMYISACKISNHNHNHDHNHNHNHNPNPNLNHNNQPIPSLEREGGGGKGIRRRGLRGYFKTYRITVRN